MLRVNCRLRFESYFAGTGQYFVPLLIEIYTSLSETPLGDRFDGEHRAGCFFVSYARVDSAFALRLAADLKGAGVSVWLDQIDIKPGRQWDSEVERALGECREMILVLSPGSVASRNVMDELAYALEEEKTIIPLLWNNAAFHSACAESSMLILGPTMLQGSKR